jgi:hypothetical protein
MMTATVRWDNTVQFPSGKILGRQTAQAVHKITLLEKFAKKNELTVTITLLAGIQTRA